MKPNKYTGVLAAIVLVATTLVVNHYLGELGMGFVLAVAGAAAMPTTAGALFASPNNFGQNYQRSLVRPGAQAYNNLPPRPFQYAVYGDMVQLHGDVAAAAKYVEYVGSPRGLMQVAAFVTLRQELSPLETKFRSVNIASHFAGLVDGDDANERTAQGHVLTGTKVALEEIRAVLETANVWTTLQPQRSATDASVLVGNRQNENIVSLIGVPLDMANSMQVGDLYSCGAISFQFNDDPRSQTVGRWIWTDGNLNATTSPTSIAPNVDQTNTQLNGTRGYVSGRVYRKVAAPEVFQFLGFLRDTQADIAANRRVAIMRRIFQYPAQVSTAVQSSLAAGAQQVTSIISAGFGPNNSTPSVAPNEQVVPVTGEVLVPYVPIGSVFVRLTRVDTEASKPKRAFTRDPLVYEQFVQYFRYGLTQATDFAIAELEALEPLVNNDIRRITSEVGGASSLFAPYSARNRDVFRSVLNIRATGEDVSVDEYSSDLLSAAIVVGKMPPLQRTLKERAHTYLFGCGKNVNPYLFSMFSNGVNSVAVDRTRIPFGFNLDGSRINGLLDSEQHKAAFAAQGILGSIPLSNNLTMPRNSFVVSIIQDIAQEIISNGGGQNYHLLTDPQGATDIERYFQNTPSAPFRIQHTQEIGSYMSPNVMTLDISGLHLKVIVLPELQHHAPGNYYLVNPGTESASYMDPIYNRQPLWISLDNDPSATGVNMVSYGLQGEIGLVLRGTEVNLWAINRV